MFFVIITLCSAVLVSAVTTASPPTYTVSPATSTPQDAANVPHDFVSFGFETVFLNDYDNDFSRNLVGSVAKRMSLVPILRVGGVSGDFVKYDRTQKQPAVCIVGNCPNGSQSVFSLGPSYFDGFKAFPNARLTVQAPMGNRSYSLLSDFELGITLDYVSLAVKVLGGVGPKLRAIELGNGANTYDPDGAAYARSAIHRAEAIVKNLTIIEQQQALFEVCETQTSYYERDNHNVSSGPHSYL